MGLTTTLSKVGKFKRRFAIYVGEAMKHAIYRKFYPVWKNKFATNFKQKRLSFINDEILGENLFSESWLNGKRFLDIGCANGKDFIQFFSGYRGVEITGIDIVDREIKQDNCSFLKIDAENLPFEEKYFDLCFSIGVFEHIEPVEKLCKVISELDRVAKSYVVVVPSISTIMEPHTTELFWQIRDSTKKRKHSYLNYFSDEAWLQFSGFRDAKIKRYTYMPFLIKNTIIYKDIN